VIGWRPTHVAISEVSAEETAKSRTMSFVRTGAVRSFNLINDRLTVKFRVDSLKGLVAV